MKIAEKFCDKLVVTKKKGIAIGRNNGAKKAKGRILVFVDADTTIPLNYIDSVVPVLENKKISGLSCAFRFDGKGRKLGFIAHVCNQYLILKGLEGNGEILGFNNAMRKESFEKVKGYPNKPLEDGAMAVRLRKIGKVVFMPEPRVTTSARRLNAAGTVKTVLYYSNLKIASEIEVPELSIKKFLKYKAYIPIR